MELEKADKDNMLADLADVFSRTIEDSIQLQSEQRQIIESFAINATHEIEDSINTMIAIEEITGQAQDIVLSQLKNDMNELVPLFDIVDAMNKDVLPALENDFNSLELVLSNLERKLTSRYPSVIQSLFSVMKLNGQQGENVVETQLHDPLSLISMLNSNDV
eukprot:gene1845-3580_t